MREIMHGICVNKDLDTNHLVLEAFPLGGGGVHEVYVTVCCLTVSSIEFADGPMLCVCLWNSVPVPTQAHILSDSPWIGFRFPKLISIQ